MPASKITVLLLFSMVSQWLYGQVKVGVNLVDSARYPIEFVTLSLVRDTSVLHTALSDKDGRVQFPNLSPGTYSINCSHIGYLWQDSSLHITTNTELTIVLLAQSNSLQ